VNKPQIVNGISKVSPSDGVEFKQNLNKETKFKNVIHEDLWKEFVNELYGLNESGENKYDKLIKLMEAFGYVENRKLSKSAFGGDKDLAKNVILSGLNKMNECGSAYRAMEEMEKSHDEIVKSFKLILGSLTYSIQTLSTLIKPGIYKPFSHPKTIPISSPCGI
jgi:hypothetical protein